jgi:hypothetical protein
MNMRSNLLACISAATLLVACGGGSSSSSDDDTPTGGKDTADKYAGSWRTECREEYSVGENPAFPAGKSHFNGIVLTKTGANAMAFSFNVAEYETINCSGPRTALFTTRGTVSLDGPKTVGTVQTDKATFNTESGAVVIGKSLLWVNNGLLYQGTQSPRDAQGYPNQIEANDPFSPI